jgi:hypothetical protein
VHLRVGVYGVGVGVYVYGYVYELAVYELAVYVYSLAALMSTHWADTDSGWQLRLPPVILEWTMRHVRHWLKYVLNLPQYVQVFEDNHINGPRLTKSCRLVVFANNSAAATN